MASLLTEACVMEDDEDEEGLFDGAIFDSAIFDTGEEEEEIIEQTPFIYILGTMPAYAYADHMAAEDYRANKLKEKKKENMRRIKLLIKAWLKVVTKAA